MIHNLSELRRVILAAGLTCGALVACGGSATPAFGQSTIRLDPAEQSRPAAMGMDDAVVWALQNHPELATFRQLRGVAAAAMVIAHTYPYNPILEARAQGVTGPPGVDISNRVATQVILTVPVELRHQRQFRKQEADALLSRTEWDIAYQETLTAVRVARAYWSVQYRQNKLDLIEETAKLNEQVADQVKRLVDSGKLRGSDLILARTEIYDVRSQTHAAKVVLAGAEADLRKSMGILNLPSVGLGPLTPVSLPTDPELLQSSACRRRADLQSRQAAVQEAEARLRLVTADRFGNPTTGPAYNLDQDRIHYIGWQLVVPLPLLNSKRGEIQQRDAERQHALLAWRQLEVTVKQEIVAALARLEQASAGVQEYQKEILPNLQKSMQGLEQLFQQGDPGADVLRLIDMRRKVLRARDGYLDSLWEMSQAQADLAAAVGDPALIVPALAGAEPADPDVHK